MSPANEPKEPWYADGLRFACTRCGKCCRGPSPGYVYVSREEIERLAQHLGVNRDSFGARFLRRGPDERLALVNKATEDCTFWDEEKGCTVYEAHPDQCRTFPFWPENLKNSRRWSAILASCPGSGHGPLHTREEIERLAAHSGPLSAASDPLPPMAEE